MNILLSLLISFSFAANMEAIKDIPVQDAGREKPFDTFARESLQLIYGKSTYKNKEGRKVGASELLMTWILFPDMWGQSEVIEVSNPNVKESLQLNKEQRYFSLVELSANKRLPTFFQELNIRVEGKEKLDSFFMAIQRLSNQMSLLSGILKGLSPAFIPQEGGWKNISQLNEEEQARFSVLIKSFLKLVSDPEAYQAEDVKAYKQWIYSLAPQGLKTKIKAEVIYNESQPFFWIWVLLLISVVCFFAFWILKKKYFLKICLSLNIISIILATYGFILRVYLTGRPPVTNMYESVLWVGWGTLFFAIIFYIWKKNAYVLLSSSLMAGICFMLADFAPNVLDPSLQPLEPVLRSNLWLTVHVLTITISYAAFLLGFGLSDVGLYYYARGGEGAKAKIKSLSDATYRAIQAGIVLLAAGTILGGVWADYSWGRFWGWDPKETWALIALLGYLALAHARLGGLIKDFGIFVGSILSFSLVIMAWYGVNFVLGAGLHSYGFGGGGIEYVSGFVFIHILYVLFCWMNKKEV